MKETRRIVIGGAILALIGIGILAYIDRVGIGGKGTIELTGIPEGAVVFLDNKRTAEARDTDVVSLRNLSIGTHTIVVAKDGYWPWSKKLTVTDDDRIRVSTFVVPQEPQMIVLQDGQPQYSAALNAFETSVTPSEDSPLLSFDTAIELWVEENIIMARWRDDEEPPAAFCITGTCNNLLTVLPANATVRSVTFFPNRNDIVLFAAENGIFAIELDKRGTQNFQPIFLGNTPRFAMLDNALVIEDLGILLLLDL